MFTCGINSKVGSIVGLSVEQKERLIESIKNWKLPDDQADQADYPDDQADYPEIREGLLPRLENSRDKDGSLEISVLEQSFILHIASISKDIDLYSHIMNNSDF